MDLKFSRPSNDSQPRSDLLIFIDESMDGRLEVDKLAHREIRSSRLKQLLDFVCPYVGRHGVGNKFEVVSQRAPATTRNHSAQSEPAGRPGVVGLPILAGVTG